MKKGRYRLMKMVIWGICVFSGVLFFSSAEGSDWVLISSEDAGFSAFDGNSKEKLFADADPLKVIEWGMSNSRITVVSPGNYAVTNAIFIPRSDISLIIDKGAKITRTDKGLRNMPYSPRNPVIYNGGHDNVTVMNLGVLGAQGRKTAIFYDGRSEGKYGIKGGKIIDTADFEKPTASHMQTAAYLVDCENVELPLVYGHGYKSFVHAEGCRNIDIGTVAALSRHSERPITLHSDRKISIGRLLSRQKAGQGGIVVRNCEDVSVGTVKFYDDPLKYVKTFNILYYGMGGKRFTKRPLLPDSEGSKVFKEQIYRRKIKDWPLDAKLIDFPESLPNLKVKVKLEAVDTDGIKEVIVDKMYELPLLPDEEFKNAPEPVFVSSSQDIVTVEGVDTGKKLYEDADAKKVIEWAMTHSPVTILRKGVFTIDAGIVIPRDNVSLIITEGAELRQNPKAEVPIMKGGRGKYRPLIHNPGHDNVEVVNLGLLQAYQKEWQNVGIHFDGRDDGKIGLHGGLIFSAGEILADDVVWVVDSEGVKIPAIIGKRYTNAPLAIEGSENLEVGIVASLAGAWARENEVIDFNSFSRNVHVEMALGTTPVEEIIDVNNSPDCVVDEIRVYRSPDDIKAVDVSDWPDRYGRIVRLMSQIPELKQSSGTVVRNSTTDDRKILNHCIKTVEIAPLEETLPQVKIKTLLKVVFEDGGEETVMDEEFVFDL